MPLPDDAYRMRERAESFGAVAGDYDRYRPAYPDALVEDLVALRPRSVLDVGCGTGIAARLLGARGLDVLGVELDPQMAAVARGQGLDVEVAGFEDWDDHGRTFDLITCAQAWHWLDPAFAAPKAARLLNEAGTLALFWNFEDIDERAQHAVEGVYERLEPALLESVVTTSNRHADRPYVEQLERHGSFRDISVRDYRWSAVYPVEHWVARAGTHSDHLVLGPQRLSDLLTALHAAIAHIGGEVRSACGTYTIFARRDI